jgi:hypothetical protein
MAGFADAVELVGDRRWAEILYDLLLPYSGANCTIGLAACFAAVDHWLGVLAAVAGRSGAAVSHLEAALERHREMGARGLQALTEEALGHVLLTAGRGADFERGRELTESAMRTAAELGLGAVADRARLRTW